MDKANYEKLYEQMNEVLREREDIYKERNEQLLRYRADLNKVEASLNVRQESLAEQTTILEEEKAHVNAVKEEIKQEREELTKTKQEIAEELENILQQKVELQALNNERLKLENAKELFAMEQSKASFGVVNTDEVRMLQEENGALKNQIQQLEEKNRMLEQENMLLREQNVPNFGTQIPETEDDIPDFGEQESYEREDAPFLKVPEEEPVKEDVGNITTLESEKEVSESQEEITEEIPEQLPEEMTSPLTVLKKEALFVFPDAEIIDTTEDKFCMQIGDKQLEIQLGELQKATIITKREKTSALKRGIKDLNRRQSEWVFAYDEDSQNLTCEMHFTAATDAEVVIQRCAEAIVQYFK